jgi:hypothetical protein
MYEACSNETCSGTVLGERVEAIKNSPTGIETGKPLMYRPMDPLCKELTGLLLEPLYHSVLDHLHLT